MTQSPSYKDQHDRDQALLKSQIDILLQTKKVKSTHEALIHLFLLRKFNANDDEIRESITDDKNDLSIDACFIDRRQEYPVIHLIQSKSFTSDRKSRNPLPYRTLEGISRFFDVLRNPELQLGKVASFKIAEKIREIRDVAHRDFPSFRAWLISNGTPPVEHELEPVASRLRSYDCEVFNFHLKDFVDLCVERRTSLDTRVFYAREDGLLRFEKFGVSGALGLISARELYSLIQDRVRSGNIDKSVFDLNVRGFLGLDNDINKNIFESANSSENYLFWALNNGITMVANSGRISQTTDKPKIQLKNLSIVNGAQTCSAIFEAMRAFDPDFSNFDHLSVPFRVFFQEDQDLIDRIAISTNRQARIVPRDLKANDNIQKSLEDKLLSVGIKYKRKRGIEEIEGDLIELDALRAGQIILSYQLQEPDRAKRDSDTIFEKQYNKIFANYDFHKLVRGFKLYQLIEEKSEFIEEEIRRKGSKRTENDFVTYGKFHILALVGILEAGKAEKIDDDLIDEAIEIIASVLEETEFPAYYTFFRNPQFTEKLMARPIQIEMNL